VKHRSAVIAGVVAVALGALVVLFATSGGDDEPGSASDSRIVGEVAPALTGTTLDGESWDLDSARGTWVLVNFFATWCPPCVQEHPELVRFSEEAGDRAEVVSVAFDDSPEKISEFFDRNGGDWTVLASDTGAASIDYGVVKLPESFLIDPEGRVTTKLTGGVTAAQLEELIGMEPPVPGGTPGDSTGPGS
jgi:cytochrome c biogenesis protein CcmG/thiol:disulfide interchange protein DsbE